MKTDYPYTTIIALEMQAKPGRDISLAISDAVIIARRSKLTVNLWFNDRKVRINPGDSLSDAMKEYAKND